MMQIIVWNGQGITYFLKTKNKMVTKIDLVILLVVVPVPSPRDIIQFENLCALASNTRV